jgi:hypothetical protein
MELRVRSRLVPLSEVTVSNGITVPRVIPTMAVKRPNLVVSFYFVERPSPFRKSSRAIIQNPWKQIDEARPVGNINQDCLADTA